MSELLYKISGGVRPEELSLCEPVSVAYPYTTDVVTKCAFDVDWTTARSYARLPDILGGNRIWKHSSGRVYYVDKITNTKHPSQKFPPTVVYTDATGAYWSRRVDDWHRSFTPMTDDEVSDWVRTQEFKS